MGVYIRHGTWVWHKKDSGVRKSKTQIDRRESLQSRIDLAIQSECYGIAPSYRLYEITDDEIFEDPAEKKRKNVHSSIDSLLHLIQVKKPRKRESKL